VTVYVDHAQVPARVGRHDARWSHLTADTEDELHAFAARLGLRRSYFQPGKALGGRPSVAWHYDVTEPKRLQALRMGTQEIELDQWHEILSRRRATWAEAASAEPGASPPAAGAALANFASERGRSAWQVGNLVQAAMLNRQCMELDPGRGETWRARAERIRAAADRAELSVTRAVRLALAGIDPDNPGLVRTREHNQALGIPQSTAEPGGREPEAGE